MKADCHLVFNSKIGIIVILHKNISTQSATKHALLYVSDGVPSRVQPSLLKLNIIALENIAQYICNTEYLKDLVIFSKGKNGDECQCV